jgi:hypothetical protein
MAPAPVRRRRRGIVYQWLGWIMVLGALPFMALTSTISQALMVFGGTALFFGGAVLLRRGMKHSAPSGGDSLAEDARRPIVYLRSFADESDDYRLTSFLRGAFGLRISADIPAWASQEQFLLGKYLSKIGPYVAIGRPGEPLPELGAHRIYVGGAWEEQVLTLLRRARLVVIRAGSTRGLHWELSQIMAAVEPSRVLMILPVSRRGYARFRQSAPGSLQRLPERQPIERLVVFADDWSPAFLADRQSIDETLRPFLERQAIDPPQQSLTWKAKW